MGLLSKLTGMFGGEEPQTVQLFACNACSNIFTKTWKGEEPSDDVSCPNCGSSNVEMTVDSP